MKSTTKKQKIPYMPVGALAGGFAAIVMKSAN